MRLRRGPGRLRRVAGPGGGGGAVGVEEFPKSILELGAGPGGSGQCGSSLSHESQGPACGEGHATCPPLRLGPCGPLPSARPAIPAVACAASQRCLGRVVGARGPLRFFRQLAEGAGFLRLRPGGVPLSAPDNSLSSREYAILDKGVGSVPDFADSVPDFAELQLGAGQSHRGVRSKHGVCFCGMVPGAGRRCWTTREVVVSGRPTRMAVPPHSRFRAC